MSVPASPGHTFAQVARRLPFGPDRSCGYPARCLSTPLNISTVSSSVVASTP